MIAIRKEDINLVTNPFKYFIKKNFFVTEYAEDLLTWLESYESWRKIVNHFYDQYEFRVQSSDKSLPPCALQLVSENFLEEIRGIIEFIYDVKLTEKVDVDLHKLLPGQSIGIHNDCTQIAGYETHRIVVRLNRGLTIADGGVLCTFNSNNIDDMDKAIKPLHNSCFSFEISEKSYHAVSPMISNQRFTLIFSMYTSLS